MSTKSNLTVPTSIIFDKNSGRAVCTLLGNAATGSRCGHVTVMFLGNYWDVLTPRQRVSILTKLGTYNGTKFTVKNTAYGGQSQHFESDELLRIRQEMILFVREMGIPFPFDASRGPVHDFHCQMRATDAVNAGLVDGAVLDFVASSGYKAQEINRG